MKIFFGAVGKREIIGTENCSFRVRERSGEFPRVFIRYPDRIEEWVLEEKSGELHLGALVAVNMRGCPKNTVEVKCEQSA